MTIDIPAGAKPGDIVTDDGKILCRDREAHEYGYYSVSYEQAQVARAHGWGCRSGVFLEAEHSDEKSWAYVEEERLYAIENGEEPPLVRICPTSAPVGQIDGLHERRMAGSS